MIVVGFGPVGAIATALLGQAGRRVLAVERTTEMFAKPRAIAIDHEILRTLQNIGVAEAVLPHVAPFPPSEHYGVDGQLIRRVDMAAPPYPLGYVPSMVFTQPPVEAALRAHAASFPSVELRLGVECVSLHEESGGVTVRMHPLGGEAYDVTARSVIACDGASSTVRQLLGIRFEDLVFDEPWLVIDMRVNASGLAKLPKTAAQYCEPTRPATFIVGPADHRRWEIMLLPGEDPRAMETEASVWRLLSRWLTPEDGTLWRANSYRFHALVAEGWRDGRVFLAGDAAHQQPPFIGQGMCQGIRDVTNLVWKLNAVDAGHAAERLLDSYEAERKQHVQTLTSRIKHIGHAICERDPVAARARDAALIASGGGEAPTVTRQDIVPPLVTGLLADGAHPARGTLFPQPWLRTAAGERRMDEAAGVGWRVVWDGRQGSAADTPGLPSIAVGGAGLPETEGVLAAWFDRYACAAAIVRPDHYVYGVALTADEVLSMLAELQRHLTAAP